MELSERQRDVLQTYVDAGSVAATAEIMGLSAQTIKNHLWNIHRRLEVKNTAQAVYYLMRERGRIC
jgi:DNA-binding NarL/FixJ family response regulator